MFIRNSSKPTQQFVKALEQEVARFLKPVNTSKSKESWKIGSIFNSSSSNDSSNDSSSSNWGVVRNDSSSNNRSSKWDGLRNFVFTSNKSSKSNKITNDGLKRTSTNKSNNPTINKDIQEVQNAIIDDMEIIDEYISDIVITTVTTDATNIPVEEKECLTSNGIKDTKTENCNSSSSQLSVNEIDSSRFASEILKILNTNNESDQENLIDNFVNNFDFKKPTDQKTLTQLEILKKKYEYENGEYENSKYKNGQYENGENDQYKNTSILVRIITAVLNKLLTENK